MGITTQLSQASRNQQRPKSAQHTTPNSHRVHEEQIHPAMQKVVRPQLRRSRDPLGKEGHSATIELHRAEDDGAEVSLSKAFVGRRMVRRGGHEIGNEHGKRAGDEDGEQLERNDGLVCCAPALERWRR